MNEKLRKAGIKDILELALFTPASYHDYRIKDFIDFEEQLFEAQILKKQKLQKLQKYQAYAKNIQKEIALIFFRTSSYHDYTFIEGATLYIGGKIKKSFGELQLIQPQKVANYKVGKIFPSYKIKIRGDIFEELKSHYLTKENLQNTGLPEDICERLLKIHYPDEEFYRGFKRHGGFYGKYLEALKFTEAFRYMKGLKTKRIYYPSLCKVEAILDPFYEQLPFTPTSDQRKALEDAKSDLAKSIAARRVIVGDVGSGKSLVMFGIAHMVGKKRAILMAPTTILATQLFEEAKRLLPSSLRIALVTSQSKEQDLEDFDFIIGTHALLYRKLPKACVVMVDEQHRFGTEQRSKLKKLVESQEGSPHFFQFSATPIPRTKAMMESSLVDFSFIKELPFKKDITTEVISKEDFKRLLIHIKNEIEQDHQVLIVYPIVEESEHYNYKSLEEASSFWMRYFDGVYYTHGKDKEKEDILQEFRDKGKILLATTVIEVGISLPRLTTIVIVGAENMGLATLHQLRGRVSRTGLKGYCFLYTHDKNNKRLQEFSKITNGFAIAELDLKYRKSGDILSGKEQSGKMFQYLNMAEDKAIVERAKALLDQ
ncbi:ATP-dependent DNA helicase RecG [Nitratiruptor sp. YY08-26]|uniref:ATP-dependent DNA helicase RecG n=1 Tax=unclassified Nitratiruptor TaxID=2624044 RepID=UPI0019161595|nr:MULTISPECIES: ATP-dependent DNA helicase RecG [unclassified Nitratiruptor]BCD62680.1 ATP-dependent DNA helicase RecG [Nitratiruptor sp. YY08-13]BCD66616.1 ATP-dependent DNA helicase RecG [Nitratiruptor sp. YY08-26]